MAFRSNFFKVEKDPKTLEREALVDRIVKDFLIPHDPRDMLASRYLNKMFDGHDSWINSAVDTFEGSPAEELIKAVATSSTQTAAKEIAILGQAFLTSGIIDKLHISDKLVDRSSVIQTILERLLKKHIVEPEVCQKLMPLAVLYQAEYSVLKKAESDAVTQIGEKIKVTQVCPAA